MIDPPLAQPVPPDHSRWFAANVQPHESMLRSWLRQTFPFLHDVDDIVQESYLHILREMARTGELQWPKAYLFRTARNLVIDRLRHERVERIDHLAGIDDLVVIDKRADVFEWVACQQEQRLLLGAIASLPQRCRQVITLRKIHGMSQKEVAAALGISEHTVEAQATIALHKITAYVARHERKGPLPGENNL